MAEASGPLLAQGARRYSAAEDSRFDFSTEAAMPVSARGRLVNQRLRAAGVVACVLAFAAFATFLAVFLGKPSHQADAVLVDLDAITSAGVDHRDPTVTCSPSDAQDCTCEGAPVGPTEWIAPEYLNNNASSLWDLSEKYYGEDVPLVKFRAKAAIVMNVASA